MLGQMAAQAAAAGNSAPANAIETHLQVAYQKPAPPGWEGSDDFEILSAYFKPYAAVRHVHYGAHAALALRAQFDLDMLEHIDLWVYQEALTYCGVRQPQTPLQAQFSLSFGVAAMLRWGQACRSIEPRKRPSAQNPSDGLTKCLTGRPFLNGRARLLGHAVPFPEVPES